MSLALSEKLLGHLTTTSEPSLDARAKTLPLGLPSVDQALPDGGLPRGAVVELTSARGLSRATTFALSACASAQSLARLRSGDARTVGAWCAFLDPFSTLHAPGAARTGVDLERLLVVRPDPSALARVAVRIAASRAFSLVVIDTAPLPGHVMMDRGARAPLTHGALTHGARSGEGISLDRWATVVRRLSLAIERSDTTVLLLTDALAQRSTVLPVAMRIELDRSEITANGAEPRRSLMLRVAKERRGRVGNAVAIDLERRDDRREVELSRVEQARVEQARVEQGIALARASEERHAS
jgi:recombination protein RecA